MKPMTLSQAAKKRRELEERERVVTRQLVAAIKRADEMGIPRTKIAEQAGVSRTTLYKMLDGS